MILQELKERYSSVEAYSTGEGENELAQRLGMNPNEILKLNANENLFVPRSYITDLIRQASDEVDPRIYPQHEGNELKKAISEVNQVKPENIVLASGGDQIIEQILSAALRPGDTVQAITPTFSMYPRTCMIKGFNYVEERLREDFSFEPDDIISNTDKESKVLILCNPNNPTANQFQRKSVMELVDNYEGMVLVDEAYAEYSKYSLIEEAEDRDNLVILRTFSKAYGLAGMRLGYLITNRELAELLNERYMMPYPVSSLTLKTGVKILEKIDYFKEKIQLTKEARDNLYLELSEMDGVKAFPSETNFILFNTRKSMRQVYSDLVNLGVVVRKIGDVPGSSECLRVTVAPAPMNKAFISALGEVIK
ncbi:histidinol-phosphate transaminase [Candidatus Bathyarchaeota archaeon]|nr:histidinol-phosphate transaminase [Candidatus Bathyarchaeota archaeon]